MPRTSEWYKRCSVVWTVENFGIEGEVLSPELSYKGNKFYLELNSMPKVYLLVMLNEDGDIAFLPLSIDVDVENSEGLAVPLSKSDPDRSIWDITVSEILEVIPDFRTKRRLTFIVNFNDDVQFVDQLSPSRAVQTPLYMENVPCLESLSGDLSNLLDIGTESDVVLVCGDRKIKAHKLLLCSRSEVFAAMLNSDLTETRTGTVDIQGMDEATFDHFVRYLYTGKLPDLTADVAKRLYEAGDQYAVKCLIGRCINFLEQNLNSESACDILALADAHSETGLKEAATNYILQKKIHIQQDDHWTAFCKSHPLLANEVYSRFCQSLKESGQPPKSKRRRVVGEAGRLSTVVIL